MNTAGALNWQQCSVPEADAAMDAGLNSNDPATVTAQYQKAGDLIVKSGCFVTIADDKEVVVAKQGYGHFTHQEPTLNTVRFGDLTIGS